MRFTSSKSAGAAAIPRHEGEIPALRAHADRLAEKYEGFIYKIIECAALDLSSTRLREMIARGENAGDMLPPGVFDYIKKNQLYE